MLNENTLHVSVTLAPLQYLVKNFSISACFAFQQVNFCAIRRLTHLNISQSMLQMRISVERFFVIDKFQTNTYFSLAHNWIRRHILFQLTSAWRFKVFDLCSQYVHRLINNFSLACFTPSDFPGDDNYKRCAN